MIRILIIVLLAMPFLDFYILFRATEYIGILPTVALILFTGLAGAELIRREGRTVFRRLGTSVTAREASRSLIEAGLLVLGGISLLTPGFLTDFLGLIIVLRPTRQRIMLRLEQKIRSSHSFRIESF